MRLPGGTVSFLMTDVEASTRLWERDAQATGQAIARHEQLLGEAIASCGGTVIKSRGEGDSVFAVFERAGDAAAAALAGQRALLAERWATPVAIRVRMAIHSGQAQLREGDYYGPAVNRCARLRGLAHGAQVVLSRASAELAREELPEGAWLESRGRHRLFTAVASWLQSCTGTDGAIVMLDDLHWADAATISLVRHLVRNPGEGRLLLMGTYRDSDLDRGRPFAEAIGELLRLDNVSRIDLSGLEVDSVRTLIASVVGGEEDDRTAELAQAIRRETDGNPFFVMEMLSHLAETGAIVRDENGKWTATTEAFGRLPIPHGAREIIGRRLSRLSETTNDVLTTAAVVGLEFAVDTVAAVLGVAGDRVLASCEEAVAANVLREQEVGRFAFTHAIVRSALYGGLSATRAAQLHFTVGETVEALGGPAADLAYHYARVRGNPTALNKTVDFLIAAGEEASGALAPEQAVRRYREAAERLDALGERDTGRRAKAMVGLGIAQRNSGDSSYRRTLLDAAAIAERLRDGDLLAEAALANFRGIWSSVFEIDSERVNVLRAALQSLPDDRPAVRARVLATLAVELYFTDEHNEIEELTDEAETIARRLGEPEVLHDVLRINTQATLNPRTFRDMHAREGEAVELAEKLGDPVRLVQACCGRSLGLWAIGDGKRARDVLERAANMSMEFVHEPSSFWIATLRTAGAVADGDPDVAEKHAKEMYARGRRLGFRDVREWSANALFAIRLLAGRLGEFEAHAHARLGDAKLPALSRANNALVLAHAGKPEEASVILDRMVERIDDLPYDLTWQWIIYLLSWTARSVSFGERSLVFYEHLLPHAGMAVVTAPAVYGTTDFALGLTAAESGRLDSACEHFSDAASFEMRAGMNGWLTFTRLEWACALLARDRAGDRQKAAELLDRAWESAERIGNRRVLARIREVRGRAQRS